LPVEERLTNLRIIEDDLSGEAVRALVACT
jgi:hypothetical protein